MAGNYKDCYANCSKTEFLKEDRTRFHIPNASKHMFSLNLFCVRKHVDFNKVLCCALSDMDGTRMYNFPMSLRDNANSQTQLWSSREKEGGWIIFFFFATAGTNPTASEKLKFLHSMQFLL